MTTVPTIAIGPHDSVRVRPGSIVVSSFGMPVWLLEIRDYVQINTGARIRMTFGGYVHNLFGVL